MGKFRDFLFPTKENNVYDTATIEQPEITKPQQQSSSAVLFNDEKPVENVNPESSFQSKGPLINDYKPDTPQVFKPQSFYEVEQIALELLKGNSIIVSLLDIEKSEARRVCDFLNGVCFSLNGEVKKIEKRIYLFSPKKTVFF